MTEKKISFVIDETELEEDIQSVETLITLAITWTPGQCDHPNSWDWTELTGQSVSIVDSID